MIPIESQKSRRSRPRNRLHRGIVALVTMLVLLVAASGCGSQQAATTPDRSQAVAKVDDNTITQGQFDDRIALLGFLYGPGADEQLQQDDVKQQILDGMIEETILLRDAEAQSVAPDPDELQAQLDQLNTYLQSTMGDQDTINTALADRGLAETSINDFFTEQMTIQALYDKVTADVTVTDDEVQAYYDNNTDQFAIPEQVHAAHILVETQQEAEDILAKLDGGADFADLATQYSQDPGSAAQGGDLGFFHRGVMYQEFEDAAFALQPGEITKEPVQTAAGFHIIKCIERQDARTPSFDEVQDQVKSQALAQKQSDSFNSYLDALKNQADIQTSF